MSTNERNISRINAIFRDSEWRPYAIEFMEEHPQFADAFANATTRDLVSRLDALLGRFDGELTIRMFNMVGVDFIVRTAENNYMAYGEYYGLDMAGRWTFTGYHIGEVYYAAQSFNYDMLNLEDDNLPKPVAPYESVWVTPPQRPIIRPRYVVENQQLADGVRVFVSMICTSDDVTGPIVMWGGKYRVDPVDQGNPFTDTSHVTLGIVSFYVDGDTVLCNYHNTDKIQHTVLNALSIYSGNIRKDRGESDGSR